MEAFYKIGSIDDTLAAHILGLGSEFAENIYSIIDETISKFALISLSSSHEDLPMWAYYASNFSGMCLEFDTEKLQIGDLKSEKLQKVIYARHPLPPITMADLQNNRLEAAVVARLIRKRAEWSHEKEWRYITGQVGPKYYIDEALTRIFLGPRIAQTHADRICNLLKSRPVEIIEAKVNGFDLELRTIRPAQDIQTCERVFGDRASIPDEIINDAEIAEFMGHYFSSFVERCKLLTFSPNLISFSGAGVAADRSSIYLWLTYRLRNGRDVYHKLYIDKGNKICGELRQ